MAKLYFRYGAMNASKSLQVLTVAHNYEEQGKSVLLLVPEMADRDGVGVIASRVGLSKPAVTVNDKTDIVSHIVDKKIDCVIVDEAQFLKEFHIHQLIFVVDRLNIPVICYGLMKDYRADFFEGSKALVLFADSVEEMKTVCAHPECKKKATMILKYKDGQPIYAGEQIEIGDAIYRSVCRYHYFMSEGVIR